MMQKILCFIAVLSLVACVGGGKVRHKDSIGSLSKKKIKVEEPIIDDALEKAMQAYRKFLEETDEENATTPEAIRRLADLQLEAGSGSYDFVKDVQKEKKKTVDRAREAKVKQEKIQADQFGKSEVDSPILGDAGEGVVATQQESGKDFEKRATKISDLPAAKAAAVALPGDVTEQEAIVNSNTEEAIELYKKLLKKYPLYNRNDQVMYQLARAYEDGARQEEAKAILDKLVVQYPDSIHYDEAQFRRGEIFFVNRKYHDSDRAYTEVIKFGNSSAFFDQALFKRGWSLFKNSLYEEALDDFVRLLDIKTAAGYHIKTESNKTEFQRVEDTFRVVSLSFSYLGGPNYIKDYFASRGVRDYEYLVYQYLAEHYLVKRRYQDAASSYNLFLDLYPLHEKAPTFHMRTIDIYRKGRFPKLVIEAKREFAIRYALNGNYWGYHDISQQPDVLAFVKTNLNDLAKHYHAVSQQARKRAERTAAYKEAANWYRTFLASFPDDEQAPELNFLLAELLFDNKAFSEAATEYERTAYAYPVHPKSAESGYAAVLAYREYESRAPAHLRADIHNQTIRSSLQFAETYPAHTEAAAVLTSAAESLFVLKEYDRAITAARQMIQSHPKAKTKLQTAAWIVIAHSTFEIASYMEAEQSYQKVLQLLPAGDAKRKGMTDKLAASVYKQAETHQRAGELEAAVEDYLRIAQVAPKSSVREVAEFDAATALITLEAWDRAVTVLQAFRRGYPKSDKQYDVTTKLALVYQKSDQILPAAKEYERIASQSKDIEVKKEALLQAAEFYKQAKEYPDAIKVYQRYVKSYPQPVEPALEARHELALLFQKAGNNRDYRRALEKIIQVEKKAGSQRTPRTKFLAAKATFELIEPTLKRFEDAKLGAPFKKTLARKKNLMQKVLDAYGRVADYQVAEMTAATTYKIAGVYYTFSQDLLESERPKNLNEEELMQYELLLEEQAYPFEEKAIAVHEKNVELLSVGVFNKWIMKSLGELGKLIPVRYAKSEQEERFFVSIY